MPLSLTTYDSLLKRRFTPQKVADLTEADRPLMARIKKDPSFSGSAMQVPLIYGRPQGIAAQSLAIAQGATSNVLPKNFLVTIADYFGTVDISSKVMLASRDNPGAFISSKTADIDGLYEQMADDTHQLLWGNGGGALGRRASASTNVITLTERTQVYAFEVGMTIAASSADGTGGADAIRVGQTTVASRDPENGTITLTSAAAITSFADNDYLFRYGDFVGATGTNLIQGVQAYIPSTSASIANLFGMVRSTDPIKLGGSRIISSLLTGLGPEERIKKLGATMTGDYKMKCFDTGYMNPQDWQNLEIALNSRGIRQLTDDKTRFGFNVLQVGVAGTLVTIYPDRCVPKGTFFGLRQDTWTLWSMTEWLHPLAGDGLTMLRKSTTNDYEYRLESFPQLGQNAPGWNGRVPLT